MRFLAYLGSFLAETNGVPQKLKKNYSKYLPSSRDANVEPQKSHVGVSSKLMFRHLPVFRWVYDKLVKATRDLVVLTASSHLKARMGLEDYHRFFSWDRPNRSRCELLVFTEGYDSKETDVFWMRWNRHGMFHVLVLFFFQAQKYQKWVNLSVLRVGVFLFWKFCRDINFSRLNIIWKKHLPFGAPKIWVTIA